MSMFVSAGGTTSASAHMRPSDEFLGPHSLHRARNESELHIVGGFPRGIGMDELREFGLRAVMHDGGLGSACSVPQCPLSE
jgi:hypothetical protein